MNEENKKTRSGEDYRDLTNGSITKKLLLFALPISSLRIKKQGEVKNFCRSHPAGPRRIGLAQSSGKSTLPTKE